MDDWQVEGIRERVTEVFARNFAERGEIGASVSVWYEGVEIVTLSAGWCEREEERPWTDETLVPVYSSTKGPAAAAFLMVLFEAGYSENDGVAEVWPELGKGQVGGLSFAQLLSHQAGLPGVLEVTAVADRMAVVRALEGTSPYWEPGRGHGYHARTIGFCLDELCERLCGKRLGEWFAERIGRVGDYDFWIGLPEGEHHRVARLYPGRFIVRKEEKEFYEAMQTEGTLSRLAFTSLKGFQSAGEMNDPAAWRGGFPAFGGVASARGLALIYQEILGYGKGLISERVRALLGQRQVEGLDQVLRVPSSFGMGPMMDARDGSGRKRRELFGPNHAAYGHPGAGGSHAFCDPDTGISIAYVMNQMELGVLPGERALGLVKAVYDEG